MNQINRFQIIFILTFYVNICLLYDYSDYDPHPHEWFRGRKLVRPQTRVISWKRDQAKGIVLTTGRDKDKTITVPNCGKSIGVQSRIVGGSNAAVGQFPWIALIETNGTPFCGGAVINERWIITAAHCFRDKKSREGLTIRIGAIDNKGGAVYPILKIVVHEKYNKDGMENSDIALLKTERVIEGLKSGNVNLVNGVCIPQKQLDEPKGKHLVVAGWGRTGEKEEQSRVLKYVKLDIIDENDCAKRFKVPMDGYPNGYNIYRSQLCAYTKKKDACQGDSGGPAIEYQDNKAVLLGVVSFGIGCASDFPGVYTKISHFLDWIAKNTD